MLHTHNPQGGCCPFRPKPTSCPNPIPPSVLGDVSNTADALVQTAKRKRGQDDKFKCPKCEYKAKQKGNLTTHLANKHGIDVQWHHCQQPGCEYKAKEKGKLTRHLANKHGIDVQWHHCQQPGCEYKAKQNNDLTRHLAFVHDINVQWHHCQQPGCEYKAKRKADLTTHLAFVHDIGVQWHECPETGCDHKFKSNSDLTRHLQRAHYQAFCQRKKVQEERVRLALLADGWLEWSSGDTLPPAGYLKREHYIDFKCAQASVDKSSCRIDFVLCVKPGCYVFLEVDEHQHRFGYAGADGAGISCDSKRMANVQTSLTIEFATAGLEPPPIYWLRYNPHEWHVDGLVRKVPKADRERRLCAFLGQMEPWYGIAIGYAFYDYDVATGLDVLSADEFPVALTEVVENLA